MRTLIVTGGAGFIGSNLVHYGLEHTTDRLVVVDKLTYAGSLQNLQGALQNPRVHGPYQFPEKLIPLMILNALDGRPLPIYGDGGNIRDWLHVEDHCAGLLLVLDRGRVGVTGAAEHEALAPDVKEVH